MTQSHFTWNGIFSIGPELGKNEHGTGNKKLKRKKRQIGKTKEPSAKQSTNGKLHIKINVIIAWQAHSTAHNELILCRYLSLQCVRESLFKWLNCWTQWIQWSQRCMKDTKTENKRIKTALHEHSS